MVIFQELDVDCKQLITPILVVFNTASIQDKNICCEHLHSSLKHATNLKIHKAGKCTLNNTK